MQNIPKVLNTKIWLDLQEELISKFTIHPIVIVLRPDLKVLNESKPKNDFIQEINNLYVSGIRNIEISWVKSQNWSDLIGRIRKEFPDIHLGAASITNEYALEEVIALDFSFAMSPFWDLKLQKKARIANQILIPGVFSPTEIQQAISFENKIIKLFPASNLGINYLDQIKASIPSIPFTIAAGGLKADDINPWLNKGYGAIALGRKFIKSDKFQLTTIKQ